MRIALVSAALAAFCIAGQAQAATTVLGNGLANICSAAAKSGDDDLDSLKTCTLAIENESMSPYDRAGTYVNRGVIRMRRKDYDDARRDFDFAIRIEPEMGEAYVNRGGALVGEKRYVDALLDIDHGLSLGSEEPEKAYYNRGLANEGLDDIKAAYFDYMRAVELAPEWDIPKRELTRFTVISPE